jgi:phage-related protein
MRLISFHGHSLAVIKRFPVAVKREVGYQLDRVQRGMHPVNWKPIHQVGPGVRELRVRGNGQFRVVYLAVFDQSVHVLHAFQKKTQKTPIQDIRAAQKAFGKLRKKRSE